MKIKLPTKTEINAKFPTNPEDQTIDEYFSNVCAIYGVEWLINRIKELNKPE